MRFSCTQCRFTAPIASAIWRCPSCGSVITIEGGDSFTRDQIVRDEPSLWRYAAVLPTPVATRVTLGEVMTPLVESRLEGATVHYKLDYLFPTGSYKDRGAGPLVSWIRERGIREVVEDSSGNAGAALPAYCARAGIACTIYAPESTSPSKLLQAKAFGARVVAVPGSRADTANAVRAAAESSFYASHNWQPMFIQGVMTWALEVWEQLGFRAPESVVVPVGNGSLLLGAARAFGMLRAGGEISSLPRLFAVQAEAFSPLVAALASGASDVPAMTGGSTVAEGVAIAQPVQGRALLKALRESGGSAVAVNDDEIIAAFRLLAHEGIYVEPTGAVGVAGLSRLIRSGLVQSDGATVVVLTGSGLKASGQIAALIDRDP